MIRRACDLDPFSAYSSRAGVGLVLPRRLRSGIFPAQTRQGIGRLPVGGPRSHRNGWNGWIDDGPLNSAPRWSDRTAVP